MTIKEARLTTLARALRDEANAIRCKLLCPGCILPGQRPVLTAKLDILIGCASRMERILGVLPEPAPECDCS